MNTHRKEHFSLAVGFALVMLMSGFVSANAASINCETAYGERHITVTETTVAFKTNDRGRSISSIDEARTNIRLNGFRKTMYKDGEKIVIHIENPSSFSDANDYLQITNSKGHKMTYPLTCNN